VSSKAGGFIEVEPDLTIEPPPQIFSDVLRGTFAQSQR